MMLVDQNWVAQSWSHVWWVRVRVVGAGAGAGVGGGYVRSEPTVAHFGGHVKGHKGNAKWTPCFENLNLFVWPLRC